jgi:hypothetical protein
MSQPLKNRVRVGGSGFTLFTFAGQPIAFCEQIAHTSPQPVAAPVAIHPMDEPYPVQVITPAAASMGSLTLRMYELYDEKVWDRLGAKIDLPSNSSPFDGLGSNDLSTEGGILNGAVDIVDIFIRIAEQNPGDVNVVKFIRPPNVGGTTGKPYQEQYHGCVITDVQDGEQIGVGTMEVTKIITVAYTNITRGTKRSKAFDYRDRPIV